MSQVPRPSLAHRLCGPWYSKCIEALNRVVNAAGLTLMGLQAVPRLSAQPGIYFKLSNAVLPSSG